MNPTTVDAGAPLTPRDVVAVARLGAQVTVGEDAIERVKRASDLVESLADDPTPHYGISTGFGALATPAYVRRSSLPTPICLTPGSSQSWGNMGLLAVRATSPR